VYGAEGTEFHDCKFTGSTLLDLDVKDNPDTTLANREVKRLYIEGCRFESNIALDGLCQDVMFQRCEFVGLQQQFNTPTNQIAFVDCREVTVTTDGDTTKKSIWTTTDVGTLTGTTTSATPLTIWKHSLQPGEVMMLDVRAVAQKLNGEEYHSIWRVHSARCDSADIAYDAQTANFTVGETLTGASSGATGVIIADADAGTTGTLSLVQIQGTFIDNEIITDSATGSARVNGTITLNAAGLVGTYATLYDQQSGSTGYDVTFGVSSQEVQVYVTGAASETTDWVVKITATSVGDLTAGF